MIIAIVPAPPHQLGPGLTAAATATLPPYYGPDPRYRPPPALNDRPPTF